MRGLRMAILFLCIPAAILVAQDRQRPSTTTLIVISPQGGEPLPTITLVIDDESTRYAIGPGKRLEFTLATGFHNLHIDREIADPAQARFGKSGLYALEKSNNVRLLAGQEAVYELRFQQDASHVQVLRVVESDVTAQEARARFSAEDPNLAENWKLPAGSWRIEAGYFPFTGSPMDAGFWDYFPLDLGFSRQFFVPDSQVSLGLGARFLGHLYSGELLAGIFGQAHYSILGLEVGAMARMVAAPQSVLSANSLLVRDPVLVPYIALRTDLTMIRTRGFAISLYANGAMLLDYRLDSTGLNPLAVYFADFFLACNMRFDAGLSLDLF